MRCTRAAEFVWPVVGARQVRGHPTGFPVGWINLFFRQVFLEAFVLDRYVLVRPMSRCRRRYCFVCCLLFVACNHRIEDEFCLFM